MGVTSESPEVTTVMEVVGVRLEFDGKTDVLHFQETIPDTTTEAVHTYWKYEENNDVALWADLVEELGISAIEKRWYTLPYGSRTTWTETLVDTTVDDGMGEVATLRLVATASWLREETVQYQGEELRLWVCSLEISGTYPFFRVGQVPYYRGAEYTFAPDIGFLFKTETECASIPGRTVTAFKSLVSHVLK